MRLNLLGAPLPLLHLLTALLTTSTVTAKPYPRDLRGLTWASLFERGGTCINPCGWEDQLCCGTGEACYTDSNSEAQCSATTSTYATATAVESGGYWQMYTTTYVETDLVTVTSVASSYVAPDTTSVAVATSTLSCAYSLNETPCGSICCASGQYCYVAGTCSAAANSGSSGYYSSYHTSAATASAGLRPTSNSVVVVTATSGPTTTVAFETPVATGSNVTFTQSSSSNSSGLSGGAIAGIVIGVLLGLALLFLICFYCCLKGIFDGLLAIFGLGNRRRRTERTEVIEERRHSSRYGDSGRTWYGTAPQSRPSRVERRDDKKSSGFGNLLPIVAGLGGLAAVLGFSRDRDRKQQEQRRRRDEKSDYSSSYGSYYTSESSASSDDRRTRDTRRSSRPR